MNNKIRNEDIENAKVKLKPIFGIVPGIYLTVFYAILVIFLLFLLFFLPGIKNNGVKVIAETIPEGATVYVDNVYMGTTPTVFFTEKGLRDFRIEKDYFETLEFSEKIGGRIFASLLVPRKFKIENSLALKDPDDFLKERFKDISSYALIEDYYDRYQMPPLLSRTVKEFLSGGNSTREIYLYNFLYSMRINMGSPEMVSDYIKAINLANNFYNSENSQIKEDLSVIFDFFANENNTEGLMLSIVKAYTTDRRMEVLDSFSNIDGVSNNLNSIIEALENTGTITEPSYNRKSITVNNLNFIGFSSGSYLSGSEIPKNTEAFLKNTNLNSYPHIVFVDDFYILEKEITRNDYSLFLEENPAWSVENLNSLISQNLVTKEYLSLQDFSDKGSPLANVSWYAASAYCDWLETKLPESLSDFSIQLPSEAEWEAAARIDLSGTANYVFSERGVSSSLAADFSRLGNSGLYDIAGNLWEWNRNWIFPTDSVNGLFGHEDSGFEGVEKAVRGGSWANSNTEISVSTRGSQDPSWCTPFLGFRPVLVKR